MSRNIHFVPIVPSASKGLVWCWVAVAVATIIAILGWSGFHSGSPVAMPVSRTERLPRCLSEWRELHGFGGSCVMTVSYHVSSQGREIIVETADGKRLDTVRYGETRRWTCDWPVKHFPAFGDPSCWWNDA